MHALLGRVVVADGAERAVLGLSQVERPRDGQPAARVLGTLAVVRPAARQADPLRRNAPLPGYGAPDLVAEVAAGPQDRGADHERLPR